MQIQPKVQDAHDRHPPKDDKQYPALGGHWRYSWLVETSTKNNTPQLPAASVSTASGNTGPELDQRRAVPRRPAGPTLARWTSCFLARILPGWPRSVAPGSPG